MSRIGNKVIVLPAGVELTNNDNVVTVKGPKGELTREFSKDIEIRVSEGFKKELEMRGVGYRAQLQGNKLVLAVGKSHPDEVEAPAGITFELPNPTTIVISGISKEKVGQTAAYVRSLRSPEPYKGKGIRYVGEYVRLKEGKTGK